MESKVTIKIKKRSLQGNLIWLLIFLPFCLGTLNDLLGLPHAIWYILDAAWLLLLFVLVCYGRSVNGTGMKGLTVWVVLFFILTLAVFPVQYQSPFYYLWGLRNNFRFYAAFFAFAAFLKEEEITDSLKWFDILFWIDIVVSVVQYFGMGLEQDNLGGLFGVESGVNGYTNIFFLIVITKSIIFYLDKKEKTWLCALKCVAALVVAALAELKFFFVEFIVVIVLAVLFTSFTWRKLWLVIGGIAGVIAGAALLVVFFPSFSGWFSLEWMLEVASADRGYTSSGDLNRLNAIPQINELWLKHWSQRIFGMGLGNCDTASFDVVNTPFFRQHGDMHYTWISYAMMYLETGYIGLLFYFGFFVLVYFGAYRIEKRSEGIARTYCRVSRIMAVMCAIIAVYNSSLRGEAAYMAYFVLAIPFVFGKRERYRKREMVSQQKELEI